MIFSFIPKYTLAVFIAFSFIMQFSPTSVSAQETKPAVSDQKNESVQKPSEEESELSRKIIRNTILWGTIPMTFGFGVKAWDWEGNHEVMSKREGWLGQNTSFGGADKTGHLYAHYAYQRMMYNIFNWTERGQSSKWLYSIGITCAVGLFIEVGDSMSSQYGFSYEDLVMDYTGIMIGALLDRFPAADAFIGLSTYWYPTQAYRSRFRDASVFKSSLECVNDYSGWKNMINFKFAGFEYFGWKVPMALKLVQLDVGFYSRGYSTYDKGRFAQEKRREVFVGISLNSAQLLKESWSEESRGSVYKASHAFLEYFHLPLGYEKNSTLSK